MRGGMGMYGAEGGAAGALAMSSFGQSLPPASAAPAMGQFGQQQQASHFGGPTQASPNAMVPRSSFSAGGGSGGAGGDVLPKPMEFVALLDHNVQAETVRQLTDMKNYLLKHVSGYCLCGVSSATININISIDIDITYIALIYLSLCSLVWS